MADAKKAAASEVQEAKKETKLLKKSDCTYTAFWCEENIYKLCETAEKHGLDLDHSYAIVISNANKTVPFMRQANSTDIDGRVVWDYHVIFLSANTGHADGPFIYDLDSTLAFPCPSLRYLLETCSPQSKWAKKYEHRFRIVPARDFLATFASDRSHMVRPNGKFFKTPPVYPPIQGASAKSKMNLPKFWDMSEPAPVEAQHTITDLRGLIAFIRTLPA